MNDQSYVCQCNALDNVEHEMGSVGCAYSDDNGGHSPECEGSCHPSCAIFQEKRAEANRRAAGAQALFTLRASAELVKALQNEQRELAAVARAGGRLITEQLAYKLLDNRYTEQAAFLRSELEGGNGQAGVNAVWSYHLDASGNNGAKGWRWQAEQAAHVGRFAGFGPSDPTVTAVLLKDAEAMVSWPIYWIALGGVR